MPCTTPPKDTQILVIGGGPAGSFSAAALAREGFDVVLLEMANFPRYHIGESLIPSVRHYLKFIGAEEKVASCGFARKPGSAIKFNQFIQEGYTDFVALGAENAVWNVLRSEFDQVLLKHAEECGVQVFEGTRVNGLQFINDPDASEGEDLGTPTSANYTTGLGETGNITFDYVVDASGRAGIISTKYLKNRRFNESLKNVAVWGYWKGAGIYGKGTPRENAPWFEALSDESGWAWFIPLHDGLTSVGIVMDQKQHGIRSRACSSASVSPCPTSPGIPPSSAQGEEPGPRKTSALAERYLTFLHLAPGVLDLIGDGELVSVDKGDVKEGQDPPMTRSASDFSYSANKYAGKRWRIIGDAGAFIDPFFSSGIHLAMTGGMAAATSIAASLRGDCSEIEAAEWHTQRIAISYTRFLVVVLSAYKQIRAQSTKVLVDIEYDNFNKAFEFLRPVIQGGAEMGAKLSEDEVQRALDFCVNLFNPTTPEQHDSVRRKLRGLSFQPSPACDDAVQVNLGDSLEDKLLDVHSPLVNPSAFTSVLRSKFRGLRLRSSSSAVADDIPSSSSFLLPPLAPLSRLPRLRSCSVAATLGLLRSPTSPTSPTSLRSPASPTSVRSLFSSDSCVLPSDSSSLSSVTSSDEDESPEGKEDVEMKMVLEKVNARRVIHAEHGQGLNSLQQESVGGFIVRLTKGSLGLVRV